ncbi:hypothetical protein PAXINDRAFT_11045 [Paxillus involutus ATCC 200175]|nr:hypothetical protein PAXINDRAFT_11045 [Paxillus involutus ATCC 200175]
MPFLSALEEYEVEAGKLNVPPTAEVTQNSSWTFQDAEPPPNLCVPCNGSA